MIPFQGDGGNYAIFAQWPLPTSPPADDNDITDAKADVINAETGEVIVADISLAYNADSLGFFATRPITDLDSIRFVQTRFKPTSENALIQDFTTAPQAVSDIHARIDDLSDSDLDIQLEPG